MTHDVAVGRLLRLDDFSLMDLESVRLILRGDSAIDWHRLDGRYLLFSIPMSDQDVFHLVEAKVYRVIGGMLAAGFPITEFIGGRKNKDSLYTKLLSKADTTASAIYDKLRFRIVTRSG